MPKRKRSQETAPEPQKRLRISATQMRPYYYHDGILMWMEKYGEQNGFKKDDEETSGMQKFILEMGIYYENNINQRLIQEHGAVKVDDAVSFDEGCEKTLQLIKQRTPVILQAYMKSHRILLNDDIEIRGIADVLVHIDYLQKFLENHQAEMTEDEQYILEKIYEDNEKSDASYYIPMDIKLSKISTLKRTGFLGNDKKTRYYKSQLYLYSLLLGEICGPCGQIACILSRKKYNSVTECEYYNNDTTFFANVIYWNDETKVDEDFRKSVELMKKIDADNGLFSKLGDEELCFPNQKHTNHSWNDIKGEISAHYGEITNIYGCGFKQRHCAFLNSIVNTQDPRLNSETLGIKEESKKYDIVNSILDINRESNEQLISVNDATKIPQQDAETIEFYVDFEFTMVDHLVYAGRDEKLREEYRGAASNFVFMIGCGYVHPVLNTFDYRCFVVNRNDKFEEKRIFRLWLEFMDDVRTRFNKSESVIYHWGHVERTTFNACKEHLLLRSKNLQWRDLLPSIKDSGLAVKGCEKFGLKSVAKAMHKHGFIASCWDDNIDGGQDAVIAYLNTVVAARENGDEKTKEQRTTVLSQIEQYNYIDVKVMEEILQYLRANFATPVQET